MASRKRLWFGLVIVVIVVLAGALWTVMRSLSTSLTTISTPESSAPAAPASVGETAQGAAVVEQAPPTEAARVSDKIDEVAGTRRMYGAHAPLRQPAVANPDSAENRQILQTMVTKALSRASEAKPAATK